MRKAWVGGNWKCNGTLKSIEDLCAALLKSTHKSTDIDVVLCPSPLHVTTLSKLLAGSHLLVGSQNVSKTGNGAFTGETSAEILMDMDVPWTLIGHSERRQFYGESDNIVADKVDYVLNKSTAKTSKLNIAVCIGELLSEREDGKTKEVCTRQMKAFIPKVTNWDRVVIAYEPVWAIGTGKVATPEQAQEAHHTIRGLVKKEVSAEVADKLRIVYGGSVTDSNCASLICQPDIDGFLVGGASLKPTFVDIISTTLSCNS